MTGAEAYLACDERGLSLCLAEGALRIGGAPDALTAELKAALTANKAEVRTILEAEGAFMAAWRRAGDLHDVGQIAEADAVIQDEMWPALMAYRRLLGKGDE